IVDVALLPVLFQGSPHTHRHLLHFKHRPDATKSRSRLACCLDVDGYVANLTVGLDAGAASTCKLAADEFQL
ncbi:hypothetical protein NQ315_011803, partial [Exocentrus adspersus]